MKKYLYFRCRHYVFVAPTGQDVSTVRADTGHIGLREDAERTQLFTDQQIKNDLNECIGEDDMALINDQQVCNHEKTAMIYFAFKINIFRNLKPYFSKQNIVYYRKQEC